MLGIAYQESEKYEEAYNVFCKLSDNGSVAAKFQKATYLYDGNIVNKNVDLAASIMVEVMRTAKEEGLQEIHQNAAECLGKNQSWI